MIHELGSKKLTIHWVFCIFIIFRFSFLVPHLAVGESLKAVLEGVTVTDQLLTNGRIELSCQADQKLAGSTFSGHLIWIFNGNRWRIEETSKNAGMTFSSVEVFDGEKRSTLTKSPSNRQGKIRQLGEISGDSEYGQVLPSLGTPYLYLTDLLERQSVADVLSKAESVRFAGRQKVDGADCYLIRFKYDNEIEGAVWIDPNRGYRFRKSICSMSHGYIVRYVTNFKKTPEEVWLPAEGSYIVFAKLFGKLRPTQKKTFTLDSANLETRIDDSEFVLEFPPGTTVSNQITGTVNTVEGDFEEVVSEEELFEIATKAKKWKYQ